MCMAVRKTAVFKSNMSTSQQDDGSMSCTEVIFSSVVTVNPVYVQYLGR